MRRFVSRFQFAVGSTFFAAILVEYLYWHKVEYEHILIAALAIFWAMLRYTD